MTHNNKTYVGDIKMVSEDAKISFLNDLDIELLDIYCKNVNVELTIEDGRITDYKRKEEIK